MNTSIKYKRLLVAPLLPDGSMSKQWVSYLDGAREGTAQFQGSSADSTTHKNVSGEALEVSRNKGDRTINWQSADLNPAAIAVLTGGVVTTTEDYIGWEPAADENTSVYISVQILSANNIVYELPKVDIDSFPIINDDDLHYFNNEGQVLKPTEGKSFSYKVLTAAGAAKKAIESFSINGTAGTITNKAIAVNLVTGTAVKALVPMFTTSLGSYAEGCGIPADFTLPRKYKVVAADGTEDEYTVTVTTTATK